MKVTIKYQVGCSNTTTCVDLDKPIETNKVNEKVVELTIDDLTFETALPEKAENIQVISVKRR